MDQNSQLSPVVISVVGLGYVGLPVAVAFGHHFETIGFDINSERISELKKGYDRTGEVEANQLAASRIQFSANIEDLKRANFHIVAVPTPVDDAKQPDLTPMKKASESVGRALKKGDTVVYESTVYPGVTEDECLPILEKISGLKCPQDFKIGYSPERINPGDKKHSFTEIKKVVSGCDAVSLDHIAATYALVVKAGVFKAKTIKVAEAAKVIENTQRDLNIALINELSIIFDQLGIDTHDVLEAAGTKWNFLPFRPGLVGGHCIGVDPYYLTHKAEKIGYIPQVILAGRRINDGMGKYVAQKTIKEMIHAGHNILNSKVTILGFTFKEDCPDTRNTRVIDIVRELNDYGVTVQVADPVADQKEVAHEYGLNLVPIDSLQPADAIVVAVKHQFFEKMTSKDIIKLSKGNPVLIDVKSTFSPEFAAEFGARYWRL